jgi:uncharacterized protein (TIGR02246 family)
MKHPSLISLLVFFFVTAARAATGTADDPAGNEVRQLEQSWASAMVSSDAARLDELLAPECSVVTVRRASVTTLTKAEWLANFRKMKYKASLADVVSVTVFGDTAVATVDLTWTVTFGGQDMTDYSYLTDVWIKRGDRWQVVRRHSSPYPKTAAQPAK